ncbi:MAG: hypothetical protein U0174_14075 [Polyangiaceae bacterium]
MREAMIRHVDRVETWLQSLRDDFEHAPLDGKRFELSRRLMSEMMANLSISRFGFERRARMMLIEAIEATGTAIALFELASAHGSDAMYAWLRGQQPLSFAAQWPGLRDPMRDAAANNEFIGYVRHCLAHRHKVAARPDASFAVFHFARSAPECSHLLTLESLALLDVLIQVWPLGAGRRKAGQPKGDKWDLLVNLLNECGFEASKRDALIADWRDWREARGTKAMTDDDLARWRKLHEKSRADQSIISGPNILEAEADADSPHAESTKQES